MATNSYLAHVVLQQAAWVAEERQQTRFHRSFQLVKVICNVEYVREHLLRSRITSRILKHSLEQHSNLHSSVRLSIRIKHTF